MHVLLLLIKCHQWGFVNTCLLKCKQKKKRFDFFFFSWNNHRGAS